MRTPSDPPNLTTESSEQGGWRSVSPKAKSPALLQQRRGSFSARSVVSQRARPGTEGGGRAQAPGASPAALTIFNSAAVAEHMRHPSSKRIYAGGTPVGSAIAR